MIFVYRREKYFLLDSPLRASLTLRDYSKVCFLRKTQFSDFKYFHLQKSGGQAMPSFKAPRAARWLVVLFCLFASTALFAQGTGGRINGRVTDLTDAVLAQVKVTLVNEANGASHDAQTNDTGDYSFVQVPVGTYRLEFDLNGFKKNIRRGVSLDINQVLTLNMVLQIGETKEVVFLITWHFAKNPQGQAYGQWFKDALDVAKYLKDNLEWLTKLTRLFHDTYYDSTLPHWLLDRLYGIDFPTSDHRSGRDIPQIAGNVCASEHSHHSCHIARRGDVNGTDTRMRVGAAQDGSVQHLRQLYIVHKGSFAGHQLRVFIPFQRLACVRHARPPFHSVMNRA